MEISNDIVQKTQKTLGKYVQKPPLTEKLLKKPPFRFLHDIIKTVIKETGFLGNLFNENELNFENVKEKDAKIAFLTKLIDAIKYVNETQLAVKPSKIVAGLEPGETNKLLQAIARAIDKKADLTEYLEKVKNGENNVVQEKHKTKKTTDASNKKSASKIATDKLSKKPSETNLKLKRSSSRDSEKSSTKLTDRKESTRDKKNKEETNKIKNSSRKKTKEPETRPTEKGEPEQVYKNSDIESIVSSNVIQNEELDVGKQLKSKNSIEEVEQQVIKDAENLPISNAVESPVEESSNNNRDNESNETVESKNSVVSSNSHDVMKTRQPSASLIRPKSARIKPSSTTTLKPDHNHRTASELPTSTEHNDSSQPPQKSSSQRPKSSLRPPSVRPSSARPGAPRLRPDSALPISETVTMGNINVIVESFDNADDEETVVIQNTVDTLEDENGADDTTPLGVLMESGENKGQLVEQILEQIQESEGDKKKIRHVDWEQDVHTKDATAKDINHLRSLIQSLTKTANPLGKLLNYLHEDLEAMHNELQMWANSKNQLYAEIEKQKKINADHSKPLLAQLKQMQQEIRKYEQEIMTVKSNILKNDLKIKELVSK